MSKTAIALLICLFVFQAGASAQPAELSKYAICKNRKISRTVRIHKLKSGACETVYTKAGIDKVVGTGKHSTSCYKVYDNIIDNLKDASWKCKDISHQAQLELPDQPEQ